MPLYFKIDKQLDGGKILQGIQKLISNNTTRDSILYIEIRNISSEDNSLIPKLEYKKTPEE